VTIAGSWSGTATALSDEVPASPASSDGLDLHY
jgi:hypothetical protein